MDLESVQSRLTEEGLTIPRAAEAPERIMPRLLRRVLAAPTTDHRQALQQIRGRMPWTPLLIYGDRVVWAAFTQDLSSEAFYYEAALDQLPNLSDKRMFTTTIDILTDCNILPGAPDPTGFIFHMSRCGSTLLSRALHGDPKNQVLFEGPPGSLGIFKMLMRNSSNSPWKPDQIQAMRNMVALCTRPETPAVAHTFVKMISWNTAYHSLYTAAFPNTKRLFLYRDPVEVFASIFKRPPECWPLVKTQEATQLVGSTTSRDQLTYLRAVLSKILTQAQQADMACLNYRHINPQNLAAIFNRAFGLDTTDEALRSMRLAFQSHAKYNRSFTDDGAKKRALLPDWFADWLNQTMDEPYQRLEQSPHNLSHHL